MPKQKCAAIAALLLFSSSTIYAQVNYSLNGTLSLTSGSDIFGISGSGFSGSAILSQTAPPLAYLTTATSASATYAATGVTMEVNDHDFQCQITTSSPTVTLIDNVGTSGAMSLGSCPLTVLNVSVLLSISVPGGYMIAPIPAALPSLVTIVSGQATLEISSQTNVVLGTYAIEDGTIQVTGTALPSITLSPTSWTPSAPFTSTVPLSQSTSVATVSGGSWLSATPATSNSSVPLTITVNPAGLAQGTYSGAVTLSYGPDYPTTQIPVTFTITPATPTAVSVAPSSGTGKAQTFTAVYSDPNGLSDLSDALLLFNTTKAKSDACAVIYLPASNKMFLYDDAGTGFKNGVTPGSSESVSNSQCTLEGSDSSISSSGTSLTLNIALDFSDRFVGQKNVYLEAIGTSQSSGLDLKGTWTPSSLGPPSVISFAPASGTGQTQTFTAVYSDPNGAADLNQVLMTFAAAGKSGGACTVFYKLETGEFYLYNGTLSTGLVPGSAQSISNNQCSLAGAASSVSASGDEITLNVALTFAAAFTGEKNVYLEAVGKTASSTLEKEGTWTP
jgi:hypothetical protein